MAAKRFISSMLIFPGSGGTGFVDWHWASVVKKLEFIKGPDGKIEK
jgi:hypothetical protein